MTDSLLIIDQYFSFSFVESREIQRKKLWVMGKEKVAVSGNFRRFGLSKRCCEEECLLCILDLEIYSVFRSIGRACACLRKKNGEVE